MNLRSFYPNLKLLRVSPILKVSIVKCRVAHPKKDTKGVMELNKGEFIISKECLKAHWFGTQKT